MEADRPWFVALVPDNPNGWLQVDECLNRPPANAVPASHAVVESSAPGYWDGFLFRELPGKGWFLWCQDRNRLALHLVGLLNDRVRGGDEKMEAGAEMLEEGRGQVMLAISNLSALLEPARKREGAQDGRNDSH